MQDYFLVLDTETSGLPKKWDLPYDAKNNWPHILQIAWIIFDSQGKEIKRENHYLKPGNFSITKASIKIHHLTKEFLLHKGKDRLSILKKLAADVLKFKPLIVGHFAMLDYHMVAAEAYRLDLPNILEGSPLFCTMKASAAYVKNPNFEYLKLNRFYKTLFNKRPENLHNALVDATLASEIFFYLLKKGEVSDEIIQQQLEKSEVEKLKPATLILPIVLFITLFILFLLWKIN